MKRYTILAALAIIPTFLPAQAPKTPAFEVADIKPSDPAVIKAGKGRMLPGGRIEVPGYTLRDLIMFSYGVTEDMILGGPKWIGEDRFDIIAKAPAGAPDADLRSMLKTLLSDRFRLTIHLEDKPMDAYALTMAKGAQPPQVSAGSAASQCRWTQLEGTMRRRECQNVTMAEFAKQLPATGGIGIALPVSDQTGLKGNYDLQFEVGGMRRRPDAPEGSAQDPFDTEGPNIFAALQKIGLHLEGKKIPMPAMVVEGAQRPAAN